MQHIVNMCYIISDMDNGGMELQVPEQIVSLLMECSQHMHAINENLTELVTIISTIVPDPKSYDASPTALSSYPPNRDKLLRQLYDEWASVYFPNLSKKGREDYEIAWIRLKKYEHCKVVDLKTPEYQDVIDTACKTVRAKKGLGWKGDPHASPLIETNLKLSRSGKEKIKKLETQLCKYAMQQDIIDKNYASFVRLPKKERAKKDIFTPQMIKVLEDNDFDETVQIILVMINTGMRPGEFFDLQRRNVHPRKRYMRGGIKTEAGIDRYIPINDRIYPYIANWYRKGASNQYLVENSRNKKMSENNWRTRDFYPTLERLHLISPPKRDRNGHLVAPRALTPHSCRHTFISNARSKGIPKEIIAMIVGHEHPDDMTEIYGHITEQDMQNMQSAANKILELPAS